MDRDAIDSASHSTEDLLRRIRETVLIDSDPSPERAAAFRRFSDEIREMRAEFVEILARAEARLEEERSGRLRAEADLARADAALRRLADERPAPAFRESEERLQLALEASQTGGWEWDDARGVLTRSTSFDAIHGIGPGQFDGSYYSYLERLHPDDRNRADAVMTEVIRERRTHYRTEYRIVRPDGGIRWLESRGKLSYCDDGRLQRVYGVCIDITERKLAAEALREESRALETLYRIGSTVAGELDLRKLIQTVIDAATELTGAQFGAFFYPSRSNGRETFTLYALSGAPVEAFSRCSTPSPACLFGPTFRGEGPIRLDDVTRDPRYGKKSPHFGLPEGHLPVRSYLALPVVSRSGEIQGGLFFGHPDPGVFTARHERILVGLAAQAAVAFENALLYEQTCEAEERLRQERNLLRTLIDNLPDYIYIKDTEGRFQLGNQSLADHSGLGSPDAIVGKTDFDFLPRERAEDFQADEREIARTGQPLLDREDCFGEPESEGALWLSTSKIPLRDACGAVVGIVGISRDITAHKRAAQAVQESNAKLHEAITELRGTQQRIVDQERLRAMGQMACGIAHDFNNALMPIAGLSELLLMRPENLADVEKATRYLVLIHTAAEDAARVVSRLSDFYRFRGEGAPFHPVPLPPLVRQAIDLTQPRWKDQALVAGAAIRIETDLQAVPPISGNEAHLRELLTNLIFNAVDAMPNGGCLTLRSYPDGGDAVLEVRDTGVGMDAETRRRCLEPFFTTKGERGSGLGLSMAKGIVHGHGGSLEIRSEPGRGSVFLLRFPGVAGAPEEALPHPPALLPALHVLLVDDEPLVREVIQDFLAEDGHTVETAADGIEGLKRFRSGRFDLIITDRSMPGMNGDRLALAIKQIAPRQPVLLMTGYGEFMLAAGERSPGVDRIVSKPLSWTDLQGAIEGVLSRDGAA